MEKELQKQFTINFFKEGEETRCEVESTAPFGGEELICGLDTLIHLFCNNTGVHPIQIVSVLQDKIVDETFNQGVGPVTDNTDKNSEEKEEK